MNPKYRASRRKHPTLADLTPEIALQEAQRDAARLLGYWYWHVADSRRMAPDLPDTILLGPARSPEPRLYFIENKAERQTSPTPGQAAVLACLARVHEPPQGLLCRPSTWDTLLQELVAHAARVPRGEI